MKAGKNPATGRRQQPNRSHNWGQMRVGSQTNESSDQQRPFQHPSSSGRALDRLGSTGLQSQLRFITKQYASRSFRVGARLLLDPIPPHFTAMPLFRGDHLFLPAGSSSGEVGGVANEEGCPSLLARNSGTGSFGEAIRSCYGIQKVCNSAISIEEVYFEYTNLVSSQHLHSATLLSERNRLICFNPNPW